MICVTTACYAFCTIQCRNICCMLHKFYVFPMSKLHHEEQKKNQSNYNCKKSQYFPKTMKFLEPLYT